MQHIRTTLAAAQSASATGSTRSPGKTPRETEFPITWVSALFKRFQGIYGQRFTSRIDGIEEIVVREWLQALDGLTGTQIEAGLQQCVTRKLEPGEQDWPPTPAEFRALCLPEQVPAMHRSYVSLPKPPQDPGVVETALARMWALLR